MFSKALHMLSLTTCSDSTHIQVLVHGEANEMGRLKAALIREYEDDPEYDIEVYNPPNTKAVTLYFRGEKMAKVRGNLNEHHKFVI